MRRRIAIIGSGISGLGAALELQSKHDVVVFEAAERLGGHIYPVPVRDGDRTVHLDTGFLGYTPATYPNVTRLLRRLEIPDATAHFRVAFWDQPSDLAYHLYDFPRLCGKRFALEAGRDLRRMVALLTRIAEDPARIRGEPSTVFSYLQSHGFHRDLLDWMILPALAVVWGFQVQEISAMSAHAALSLLRRTIFVDSDTEFMRVPPSTKAYHDALMAALRCDTRTRTSVREVRAESDGVYVGLDGHGEHFDGAVMALPPWCALEVLSRPSEAQVRFLTPLKPNHTLAVVHRDTGIVPGERRGDGAFLVTRFGPNEEPTLTATWDLARFQEISAARPLLVTMGDERILTDRRVNPDLVDTVIRHRHVAMTPAYAAMDGMAHELDDGRLVFSGSYLGPVGSHECAYASALDAATRLTSKLSQSAA